MIFLAKGIMLYSGKNRFKLKTFSTKEKALRFWEKCKRKGLCAHLVY